MKSATKKITLAGLGAVCALSLSLGAGFLAKNNVVANADTVSGAPNASTYFYDGMTDTDGNEYTLAKKFYKVLEAMNDNGDFVDGVVDYNISDVVTSDQLKAWVEDGDLEVPKAFSAARDAFLTDHPEIFYINFYKMTISVAISGGAYVGFLNSGREANLYYDNGFRTQTDVEKAITAFENRIDEIVAAVNQSEAENNFYLASDVYLAKAVNTYLAENISYDYASYANKDDPNYVAAAYINTPYGGLVEGKAVCGGFSTAYKVILDKLGIPCITVNGYSNNKDEYGFNTASSVYHMWNYVWLENPVQSKTRAASDGAWYSVDVTWDSASYSRTRYAVMNAYVDAELHVTDGVISSGGYELIYPELSQYTYGGTADTDGLQLSLTYDPTNKLDDNGNVLYSTYITVSYNGKSAKRLLEEDGLYLAIRCSYYYQGENGMELVWTNWYSIEIWRQFAIDYEGAGEDATELIQDTGNQTRIYENTSAYCIQTAVFDVKPDRATPDTYAGNDPTLGKDPVTEYYYFYYFSNDLVEKTTAVAVSDIEVNETYGTYTPPPYIVYDPDTTDNFSSIKVINDNMRSNKGDSKMDEKYAFTLTATYDQPLHILDDTKPIGISFTSIHPNAQQYAFFVPFDDGAYVHLLDDEHTLEFKFCPSLMYEHNRDDYDFFFTNVGSKQLVQVKVNGVLTTKTSDKLPNNALYCFERVYMACPKMFNYDGRLWVDCCAQPQLVANSDLSAMEFLDENGESTFSENQRSQMMLVAERADTSTVDAILDGIDGIEGSNVTKSDIKTSETYDIYLQMCNQVPVITDGSYVRIALGFPEGYGPNDEGVTFKIYHRKHIQGDEYIIEEIPCVVTQFGIVAVCTSFSPYMVAVVDADKATSKNVYASIEGGGGTLTNEDGRIISFNEGDSHTYTIYPDDGYLIYSVTLNGVNVLDRVVNGKLTLGYDDLAMNNQLVIQYIATEAAARIQQKLDNNVIEQAIEVGKYIVDTNGNTVANTSMPGFDVNPENFVQVIRDTDQPDGGLNVAIILIILACVVVVLAVALTITFVALRKIKKS